MNILQSRLDAEFLLAHMCTVGFKEWIVVLATLLRRMEVRYPLLIASFKMFFHTALICLHHKSVQIKLPVA